MKQSVLVLGASGMFGHKACQVAVRRGFEVSATYRSRYGVSDELWNHIFSNVNLIQQDAEDTHGMEDLISKIQPDFIINAIGSIKHRNPDKYTSIKVNSVFPHELTMCLPAHCRMVSLSTDCVFDGVTGHDATSCGMNAYSINASPNAHDPYGMSKALGEIMDPQVLTLRTSIIGRELFHRTGLLEWFLTSRGEVKGFDGHYFSGVTTERLADKICDVLELGPEKFPSGILHFASEPISKFRLLHHLQHAYSKQDIQIKHDVSTRLNRVLKSSYEKPSWVDMIEKLTHDATPY